MRLVKAQTAVAEQTAVMDMIASSARQVRVLTIVGKISLTNNEYRVSVVWDVTHPSARYV